MAKNGYGQALVLTPAGTLTSVLKSVTNPGLTTRTERIRKTADTYREGTVYPLDTTHGNMHVVMDWDKTLHDALWDGQEARTKQSVVYTDAEGNTCTGDAYIINTSEMAEGTDGHAEFSIDLEPETRWVRTPYAGS